MSLLRQAPRFDITGAARVALEVYGLAAAVTALPSERDQNFLLTTSARERFVLKIANATEDRAMLEAQNAALAHLEGRVTFCPRVLPTLAGETIGVVSGTGHFVRLLTYLDGTPLAEIESRPPALLESLGRKLGRLDAVLANFDHPALHRDFHWDLVNAAKVIAEHLPLIRDDGHRELVERVSASALKYLEPRRNALRRSPVHHDANDWNVLIATYQVNGIIDFGDMVHSWTVADPAVAIAYAMLDAWDPLATAAEIARGYHKAYPLRNDELASLFPLASLRLCMSACIAAWQQQQRPDDVYLVVSQGPILRTLPIVASVPPSVAEHSLRTACGLGPPA